MSAATILTKGMNTVEGEHKLKINICNITGVDVLAQQILQLQEQAAKITTIEIDTSSYFQALEEQEESAQQVSEDTVCQSLSIILDTVASFDGNLKTFSWPAPEHTGSHFTRPHSFWSALYAHSGTLQNLHLAFFCHEVHSLPPPPPGTTFEALKDLRLDTSSAHGDDGTTVDTLLKTCPNLSTLHVEWPPCDLESCQIKNLSWDWDFPQLEHLHTSGWNFAPASYTNFLVRHPDLTSIEERVDGPYESEQCGSAPVRLPTTALQKLRVLEKEYKDTYSLRDYSDPVASRPIHTLVLHVHNYESIEQELLDIAVLPTAQAGLRTLEFRGGISCWRRCKREESSEDEDDDDTPEERDLRRQRAERKEMSPRHR